MLTLGADLNASIHGTVGAVCLSLYVLACDVRSCITFFHSPVVSDVLVDALWAVHSRPSCTVWHAACGWMSETGRCFTLGAELNAPMTLWAPYAKGSSINYVSSWMTPYLSTRGGVTYVHAQRFAILLRIATCLLMHSMKPWSTILVS